MKNNRDSLAAVSAFIDGECDDIDRLLDAMRHNPGLKKRLSQYVFNRSLMHGDRPGSLAPDFANRVSAAIKQEPTLLSPAAPSQAFQQLDTSVVPLRSPPAKSRRSNVWRKSWANWSLAASVAAVSWLVISENQWFSQQKIDISPPRIVQGIQPQPAQIASNGGTYWNLDDGNKPRSPALEQRLNMYLGDHIESSYSNSPRGRFSYAGLVGYDAAK